MGGGLAFHEQFFFISSVRGGELSKDLEVWLEEVAQSRKQLNLKSVGGRLILGDCFQLES